MPSPPDSPSTFPRLVGRAVERVEDAALLAGRGRFADDVGERPGTAHAAVLRSPHAHAEIVSLDATAALLMPEVVTVLTGEDIVAWSRPFIAGVKQPMRHYALAVDRVRYTGEPVAGGGGARPLCGRRRARTDRGRIPRARPGGRSGRRGRARRTATAPRRRLERRERPALALRRPRRCVRERSAPVGDLGALSAQCVHPDRGVRRRGRTPRGRRVRRCYATLAVAGHNVPTTDRSLGIEDPESRLQVETLSTNCEEFGVEVFDMLDPRQGIVHVIGPEQGFTLPGTTVVCCDSHTATHGAFGALAFGIGTSESEHVLATQTLRASRPKSMRVTVDDPLPAGCTGKDLILAIIGRIGTAGGTGHIIEYSGRAIRDLSMEGRMTVSNMTIEGGARAGLVAPDAKTFAYLEGRPMAPKGAQWDAAVAYWSTLASDGGAVYDKEVRIEAADIAPQVTWGTSPEDVVPITSVVPDPEDAPSEAKRGAMTRALQYMGLVPGTRMTDIAVDNVFIGSCTNGRIEDLRAAAAVVRDRKVASNVDAMVSPGSTFIKLQAESEGLDRIFIEAGFQWRESGCSMCLGMNPDRVGAGKRCASTSNRNFEGRQGRDARTHLVSPPMAAAAAVSGRLADVREMLG